MLKMHSKDRACMYIARTSHPITRLKTLKRGMKSCSEPWEKSGNLRESVAKLVLFEMCSNTESNIYIFTSCYK